ncbi:hypothetical protein CSUNSWCD_810 [Campylobacter showae CSUNSWCD]|uniref:Uncharacterized protein n=1 Tax=Campylobacter showae CSUNSWCD TaxID=1244083 RepID=M5INP9_9BACT|nr:hypothetical protein CSUNSWCD_810 [Campylobacter showae CSUNSWCD]
MDVKFDSLLFNLASFKCKFMRYFTNEILKTMSNLPLLNLTQILVYKFTKFIPKF